MDFGSTYAGFPNGIPVNIVGNATPRQPISYHDPNYADESDPMPPDGLPVPDRVLIENARWDGDTLVMATDADGNDTGDHHMILHDVDRDEAWELYSIRPPEPDGAYSTGAVAFFDLKSNAMRKDGNTSADAGGGAILPALITYDQAASGEIKHALRMTLDLAWGHVWPARHDSFAGGEQNPPFGTWFRMKPEVPIDGHYPIYDDNGNIIGMYDAIVSPINRAILQCMKDYGIILMDTGGDWFIQGQPDPRWNSDDLSLIQLFPPHACFDAISGAALMIDINSGQARQL